MASRVCRPPGFVRLVGLSGSLRDNQAASTNCSILKIILLVTQSEKQDIQRIICFNYICREDFVDILINVLQFLFIHYIILDF